MGQRSEKIVFNSVLNFRRVTHFRLSLLETPPTPSLFFDKKNAVIPNFYDSGKKIIGATIRIGREIRCLPYAGFYHTYEIHSTLITQQNKLQSC